MRLVELLRGDLIKVGLDSTDKSSVFMEMVELCVNAGALQDLDLALQALFEREVLMSTGIAKWLGLPHGKLVEVGEPVVAIGISEKGIEYDSLDGELVYVVFMLFSNPNNPNSHLELLAEVSHILAKPDLLASLRVAKSVEEVLLIIEATE